MATFISHIRFTEQGIKGIGQTTKRAAALKAAAKKMGASIKEVYWTLGDCDGVVILEADDDETATAVMLQLGMLGNVHTSTCRAFNAREMDAIIGKLKG